MPDMRKDKHSGAIIFDLTPSEIEVKELKDTVKGLTKELGDIKKSISDVKVGAEHE